MGFEFQEMLETLSWIGIQAQKWRCCKIETWRRDENETWRRDDFQLTVAQILIVLNDALY